MRIIPTISAFFIIYFDLDNTLIDYNSSERKAIEFIFKEKYGLVLNNNQTDYWSKISRKYFDYYLSKQITFEEQGKNRFIKRIFCKINQTWTSLSGVSCCPGCFFYNS